MKKLNLLYVCLISLPLSIAGCKAFESEIKIENRVARNYINWQAQKYWNQGKHGKVVELYKSTQNFKELERMVIWYFDKGKEKDGLDLIDYLEGKDYKFDELKNQINIGSDELTQKQVSK